MRFSLKRSAEKPKSPLDPGVAALGWVSFLTDVSADMIYPLLPQFITRTLGAGPAALGLIEGVAESTASLTKLGSGWWSDRSARRKPIVVLGYSIAALARPLVAFASSWTHVLAIRFSDRIGKGIRTPPRDALLAGLVPQGKRGRAYGLQRAMDNAGSVVGPLVAALLLRFWIKEERILFLLAFIPGLLGLLLLARVREAPRPPRPAVASPAGRGPLPRRLWIAIGIFFLFTLANSSDAFLLLRARDCGIPIWQLPLLWSFFNGVKAALGVPGGILADRIGSVAAICLGWLVYALSYGGFAVAASPLMAWGLFGLYGLFFALTEGAERALVAGLVSEEQRGRAFGAFHAAIGLASLPASVLFGLLWTLAGPRAAFAAGAAVALASTVLLLAFRGRIAASAPEE